MPFAEMTHRAQLTHTPDNTILLVEDDADTREVLVQALEQSGYFVFCAHDGWTALGLLRRMQPPSLILLDLMMPHMDGSEFLKAVEGLPALKTIPVLVVSAFPGDARSSIPRAFIQKPVDLDSLVSAVGKHIHGETTLSA